MTWKQMTEVVASCEDFCKVYGRVPYFYITGGDPILHPDFWKLMVLLKSKKIPFTLMGNPFHLNDEICRMLKVCGCEKYQMSLDGMRETHDWFRKPGSFDLTIEKIGCLNRAGIKSVIMSTVSKTNMNEIPDIMACRRVTDSKVANGTSGNFYGADPQCWKTRNEITGEVLEE